MAKPREVRLLHIFGDESSHRGNHKYLVYGTVSCERSKLPKVLARLEKASCGKSFEWKWSGNHHRRLYPGFVDAIFECRKDYGLRYRCLVVNTHHARHTEYNDNDPDLGLEKYIYFHLKDYARRQSTEARFFVSLDKRTHKYTGETQKRALNARDRAEFGRTYDIFQDVLDVDSKSSRLVQAADVLSGAIAWVWNERYLAPDASKHKRELAEHIAKRARIPSMGPAERAGVKRGELESLAFDTPAPVANTCGFAIWHLHLRAKEEAEMRALSAVQRACFPTWLTYGELKKMGYVTVGACPRCDRYTADLVVALPGFGERTLDQRFRQPCKKCFRAGVLLFQPDPLKVPPRLPSSRPAG